MIWLVGAVLFALCVAALHGHYRGWQGRKQAKLLECAAKGHDYGPVQYAYNSPWWPYQRCNRCGHQEHHKTCVACGKTIKDGKVCDGD